MGRVNIELPLIWSKDLAGYYRQWLSPIAAAVGVVELSTLALGISSDSREAPEGQWASMVLCTPR